MSTEITPRDARWDLLAGLDLPDPGDSADIAARIFAQLVQAQSDDELFADATTVAAKDLIGSVFTLRDIRVMPSELPDSDFPFYLLLDTVDLNGGGELIINTGAPRLMAIALNLKQRGELPRDLELVAQREGKPGQSPVLGFRPHRRSE